MNTTVTEQQKQMAHTGKKENANKKVYKSDILIENNETTINLKNARFFSDFRLCL